MAPKERSLSASVFFYGMAALPHTLRGGAHEQRPTPRCRSRAGQPEYQAQRTKKGIWRATRRSSIRNSLTSSARTHPKQKASRPTKHCRTKRPRFNRDRRAEVADIRSARGKPLLHAKYEGARRKIQ